MTRRRLSAIVSVLLAVALLVSAGWYLYDRYWPREAPAAPAVSVSLDAIPAFSGEPYVALNGNQPNFTEADYTTASYESYADLDALGRCGVTVACVGRDIMPTEARGAIGQVKPTGWHTVKYDWVDGKYLYNRCHLIGFQLTGENANVCNLITGTRYLNVDGMLPFENLVADYVKETGNHVLYRVIPLFEGNDLVARGVTMEGYSVEDEGEGVCFYVYCYNNQPGVTIDYATGDSAADGTIGASSGEKATYVLNTGTKKFHLPTCSSVKDIKPEKKQEVTAAREDLIRQGYSPCGSCKP
ncbi:MAG: DNA/RNA non-specific endonuclease [Clostridia bacterium]|nr:DNA/RNA non-specific endonuclease [Clostridia bacterium]